MKRFWRIVSIHWGPENGGNFDWLNDPVYGGGDSSFEQGISTATRAVSKDKCAALFAKAGIDSIDALNRYVINRLITVGAKDGLGNKFPSGDVGAATGGSGSYVSAAGVNTSTQKIVINSSGFFFSGRTDAGQFVNQVSGIGFQGLSMAEIRGAVIIHEILHALGVIPHDGADLKDNGKQSKANSELVRTNCF